MAIDWFATVSAAGEAAKRAVAQIPPKLAIREMSLEEATDLYNMIESHAQNCDAMIAEMQDDDEVDDDLLTAAEALQDAWDSLSVACANKVRELQGLPLIPMPFDDDED